MTNKKTILQFKAVDGQGWYASQHLNVIKLSKSYQISPASTELRYEDNELIGGDSHMLFANFENARFHMRRIQEYFDRLFIQLG